MSNAAPNPFDPAALRLKNSNGVAGVTKLINRIPVRKPGKQEFFRTHPDAAYRMDAGIITVKEDDAVYAVTGEMQEELADLVEAVTIYTIVTRQGTVMLWPVRLPGADGKSHDAWSSSHAAAELATGNWTRIQWNLHLGAYDTYQATGIAVEPSWPTLEFAELLKIGFQGKLIDSVDHLAIRKLRGEA